MKPSLRRTLLINLTSITLLVWVATTLVSFAGVRQEAEQLFDTHLAQAAEVLGSLVKHELTEEYWFASKTLPAEDQRILQIGQTLTDHRYQTTLAFQIRVSQDRFVFRSAAAPPVILSAALDGFSDEEVQGERWRVFTLGEHEGQIRIHVGERQAVRDASIHNISQRVIAPLLVGLPLMGFMIWFSVGHALRPLSRLVGAVAAREPSHLQPIPTRHMLVEARPVVDALNTLLERLQQAFQMERRFTADAAHELRAPLVALKIQAQTAARAEQGPERHQALKQLIAGVDRATRLAEQLLTLACLDPERVHEAWERTELCEVAAQVIADLTPDAQQRGINVDLDQPCSGAVAGNDATLRILLRNVFDNAIRYTPAGGTVRINVTTQLESHKIRLCVDDSGPGIPEADQERVFERFYRQPNSQATGSGLGLSIARLISTLHGAEIYLGTSPHRGLRVTVLFPSADLEDRD